LKGGNFPLAPSFLAALCASAGSCGTPPLWCTPSRCSCKNQSAAWGHPRRAVNEKGSYEDLHFYPSLSGFDVLQVDVINGSESFYICNRRLTGTGFLREKTGSFCARDDGRCAKAQRRPTTLGSTRRGTRPQGIGRTGTEAVRPSLEDDTLKHPKGWNRRRPAGAQFSCRIKKKSGKCYETHHLLRHHCL
jgi:hypothetical protein